MASWEKDDELEALRTQVDVLQAVCESNAKLINKLVEDMIRLSRLDIEAVVIPTTNARMYMQAERKNEITKVMDVKADHGLMIYPDGRGYKIVTIGLPSKGLTMLAHIMRWMVHSEHGGQFLQTMNTLDEAASHVSL